MIITSSTDEINTEQLLNVWLVSCILLLGLRLLGRAGRPLTEQVLPDIRPVEPVKLLELDLQLAGGGGLARPRGFRSFSLLPKYKDRNQTPV